MKRTLPLIPSARSAVAPFMAMDVLRDAGHLEAQGRSVIHLEIGEPGAPPPRAVREAAIAALGGARIGYTDALGRTSLRRRIARHYGETYGIDMSPERIVVTTGSSGAFALAFLSLFNPGDRIAIAAPGYPAYRNLLEALGCICVTLETHAAQRYSVTAEMIEEAHRIEPLRGVLLMSPANPSGVMMTRQVLSDVCQTCDTLGITFISDEIYHGLTYQEPAQTALYYSDDTIIINSFSKYYCMTGWRIGWLVVPPQLVRVIERLQQSLAISVPYLSQIAAEAAFDATSELEQVKNGYARNRALLLQCLPQLGFGEFQPPDGAFYYYSDISNLTSNSLMFCKAMLQEAGVAATPGVDFDRNRGQHTIRFSYAGPEADISEAIIRLRSWMKDGA